MLIAFQVGDEQRHRTEAFGRTISLDYYLRQPGFVAELLAQSGFRMRDQPEPYVRQAMYRHQINRWRRKARRPETVMATPPDRPAAGDFAADNALRHSLFQALAEVPPRQRAVLVLRYYEDRPEAEVAAILGISVGTVRSQASRALARLREEHPNLAGPLILQGAQS